jgi:hypothetical protein
MQEARAQWWYYSYVVDSIVENGRIRGVVVESKSGREAILAKVVIDASGDGDVAARAGASYELGREGDGLCQPLTLMFEVDGVTAFPVQQNAGELYDALLASQKVHGGPALPFGRAKNVPWIIHNARRDTASVQATHVYRVNALDTRELTGATVEARRQAHELTRLLRGVPGLERIRLVQTAPAIGVREARRIHGHYRLTVDDISTGRFFEGRCNVWQFPLGRTRGEPGRGCPFRPHPRYTSVRHPLPSHAASRCRRVARGGTLHLRIARGTCLVPCDGYLHGNGTGRRTGGCDLCGGEQDAPSTRRRASTAGPPG